uniref:Inhibitor of apoptosis protein n=1 Tax=Dendrolimus kikuchii nucleopolyhedrovirus TaxID=1219875 RepID=V9LSU2_9ABAC|nr:inhibitor of apoptosis protein [Dendrolimus kikuchii nucleopolyhedrovirus]
MSDDDAGVAEAATRVTLAPVYLINVCETMQHDIEHMFDMLVDRHNSFKNYPISDTTLINDLIINGFKFNQVDDHVVCQYCDVEIGNWSVHDCVESVHVALSPHCLYARKIAQHNETSAPLDDEAAATAAFQTETILVKRGKVKCMYNCMSNVQARVNTFADHWPAVLRGLVSSIADAGLFYSGRGDETVCFFCDCRVHEWRIDDDAWRRHALANPQCYFVTAIKGDDFCSSSSSSSNSFNAKTTVITDDDDDDDTNTAVNENVNAVVVHSGEPVDSESSYFSGVCTVCWERQRDAVLLPCRHFCTCIQCYFGLKNKCPTCRREVVDFIKVYVT